jgi:hypothetical protein
MSHDLFNRGFRHVFPVTRVGSLRVYPVFHTIFDRSCTDGPMAMRRISYVLFSRGNLGTSKQEIQQNLDHIKDRQDYRGDMRQAAFRPCRY